MGGLIYERRTQNMQMQKYVNIQNTTSTERQFLSHCGFYGRDTEFVLIAALDREHRVIANF